MDPDADDVAGLIAFTMAALLPQPYWLLALGYLLLLWGVRGLRRMNAPRWFVVASLIEFTLGAAATWFGAVCC